MPQPRLVFPGADVLELGTFSPEDVGTLRQACGIWWTLVLHQRDASLRFGSDPGYTAGRTALSALSNYFSAPANAAAVDESVRILAFLTDEGSAPPSCDASAVSVAGLGLAAPTYIVRVAADGLPLLYARVVALIGALPPATRAQLPGAAPHGLDVTTEHCTTVAVLFIFLHEMAHVLRGHLDFERPIGGRCAAMTDDQRSVRRALETDADFTATYLLGTFLRGYARSIGAPHPESADESWLAAGLLASLAVFSILSEGTPASSPCYHLPVTRVSVVAQAFGGAMRIEHKTVMRVFVGLTSQLLLPATQLEQFLRTGGVDEGRRDDAAMRGVTLPLQRTLLKAGRLTGWTLGQADHTRTDSEAD